MDVTRRDITNGREVLWKENFEAFSRIFFECNDMLFYLETMRKVPTIKVAKKLLIERYERGGTEIGALVQPEFIIDGNRHSVSLKEDCKVSIKKWIRLSKLKSLGV